MDIKRLLHPGKDKEVPAPLWRRILAYLIDLLALAFILLPLQPTFALEFQSFTSFFTVFTTQPTLGWQFLLLVATTLILSLAYWSILEYRYHQTLGKYLLQVCVQSEEKHLHYGQCLLRNLAKLSSVLLLLDVLYMVFKHTSQRYSETLAKTHVVTRHG
mgnify:CR=1 FL=1